MRPKMTPYLVLRNGGFLAFFLWGACTVFRIPGGSLPMRIAVGCVFGILCIEAAIPIFRALPFVSERLDFPLAGIQYVVVPALGLLVLVLAVGGLCFSGELDLTAMLKSAGTAAALCIMIGSFTQKAWKKYRADRSKTRQQRLAELEGRFQRGEFSREEYLNRRETIYESAWKSET